MSSNSISPVAEALVAREEKVLVTGADGFLGRPSCCRASPSKLLSCCRFAQDRY